LLSSLRRHIDNFNRRLPALCLLQEILQIRRCLIVNSALAALITHLCGNMPDDKHTSFIIDSECDRAFLEYFSTDRTTIGLDHGGLSFCEILNPREDDWRFSNSDQTIFPSRIGMINPPPRHYQNSSTGIVF
jgi:hypothetical protein